MNINPTAFSVFGIDIQWYAILIVSGALFAIYFDTKLGKREGFDEDIISDFAFLALLFGIIGARVYFVAFNWDYYSANPSQIINIRGGGLGIYGGIIAGIIVGIIYCRYKKIPFFKMADCIIPGVSLAQGIGRWGNFINGEAHGGSTNLPWAILVDGQKVHPTFLYESILDIGIFLFLYCYLSKHKKFDGQLFVVYLIVYGIGRFFIEGLRTDSLYIGAFRVSQIVSIAMILFGAAYTFYMLNKKK